MTTEKKFWHNHFADGGLHPDCPRCRLDRFSPDLLEACKAVQYILKQSGQLADELRRQPWFKKMESAIHKAEQGAN